MTELELQKAISRGQGRAILFLRQASAGAPFDFVLDCCRKDQAFDPMFEDRSEYMCRLVDTLARPNDLAIPLGKLLFQSRIRRDRRQIRQILGHLRRAGSEEAREILVRDFRRFHLKDRSFTDAIELLGFEGLLLLFGQSKKLEDWELRAKYEESIEQFGEERAREAFELLPDSRKAVITEADRTPKRKKPKVAVSASECLDRLRRGEFVSTLDFSKTADETDWKSAAKIAIESSDLAVLRRATFLFRQKPWPLNIEDALALAAAESNPEHRQYRLLLLQATQSDSVRSWAVGRLSDKRRTSDYEASFRLLRLNAESVDLPMLTKAHSRLRRNPEQFHFAGLDVLNLRCGNTVEMLQFMYEHGPCDLCRNTVIRQLAERQAISHQQRLECLEDSDECTRKWAADSLNDVDFHYQEIEGAG